MAVLLRIRLLVFMGLTAERDDVMWFYGWSMPYTRPPTSAQTVTFGELQPINFNLLTY